MHAMRAIVTGDAGPGGPRKWPVVSESARESAIRQQRALLLYPNVLTQ